MYTHTRALMFCNYLSFRSYLYLHLYFFTGAVVALLFNHNKILNNLTRNLLGGGSGLAVYDYGRGERLTTQYPAYVNNRPLFFIQIVTPTSEIYSKINSALSAQRTEIVSLSVAASVIAIAVLVIARLFLKLIV
jgi:hypothetical protein